MADEKDRFGDKLRHKEKGEEDRYFKDQDQAAIERLRKSRAGAAAAPAAKIVCPRDGTALAAIDNHGVVVDECPTCRGVWLDAGELEALASRERDSWLGRLFLRPRR